MKALAVTLTLGFGLAVLPGSTLAADQAMPVSHEVLVTITGIPQGATHGIFTFTGVGKVESAQARFGAPATATPLNSRAGQGFTLDFKPKYSGHDRVDVCFGPATRPTAVRFARGTWSFAPAMVIKPISPRTVSHGSDCRE